MILKKERSSLSMKIEFIDVFGIARRDCAVQPAVEPVKASARVEGDAIKSRREGRRTAELKAATRCFQLLWTFQPQ